MRRFERECTGKHARPEISIHDRRWLTAGQHATCKMDYSPHVGAQCSCSVHSVSCRSAPRSRSETFSENTRNTPCQSQFLNAASCTVVEILIVRRHVDQPERELLLCIDASLSSTDRNFVAQDPCVPSECLYLSRFSSRNTTPSHFSSRRWRNLGADISVGLRARRLPTERTVRG